MFLLGIQKASQLLGARGLLLLPVHTPHWRWFPLIFLFLFRLYSWLFFPGRHSLVASFQVGQGCGSAFTPYAF